MGYGARRTAKKSGVGRIIMNVLGVLLCVVFIPIVVVNVLLIVRSYTQPDKLPMVFGYSPVIVLSNSMFPEFEAGDMVLLQKVDPNTLKEGDVICFFEDGNKDIAVTHRIVEVQDDGGQPVFVTKGDANNTEDRTAVTLDMVQGRYTGGVIPGLGNLAVSLQTPLGMVLCIVCPLVLFLLWDGVRRLIFSRKNAKNTESMEEELERLRAQVAQGGSNHEEGPGSPRE